MVHNVRFSMPVFTLLLTGDSMCADNRLEQECQTQLLADAAATARNIQTMKITPEDAAFTYKNTGTEKAGYFMAQVGVLFPL